MGKVYKRTENGVYSLISRSEGLAEINHAMTAGKRNVRTMSSITRTDYDIEYKDGRSVRLVLIDAPAPEGFTQGQAVVVHRPGQAPITGTVAHIHTAPGYVAVLDDRYRAVSNYPTRFVSAAEMEEEPTPAGATGGADAHVISCNGGKVHTAMPGLDDEEEHVYPLCRGGGMNQMLTKFRVVDAPLTCKTCLTYAERRATRLSSESR
jgi:hypothetical protein